MKEKMMREKRELFIYSRGRSMNIYTNVGVGWCERCTVPDPTLRHERPTAGKTGDQIA